MEWHAGNALSHTVFTFLYVHHLEDIDPDFLTGGPSDSSRPLELITSVLRAAVIGLLKCCDLSWRELSKEHVKDVMLSFSAERQLKLTSDAGRRLAER